MNGRIDLDLSHGTGWRDEVRTWLRANDIDTREVADRPGDEIVIDGDPAVIRFTRYPLDPDGKKQWRPDRTDILTEDAAVPLRVPLPDHLNDGPRVP